jgi:hypothetical protein
MNTNSWSMVAFLGLSLGAASVEAQGGRDAQVVVPLARGAVGVSAPSAVPEGAVIEELPAVTAPRWTAEDSAATQELYWLGLFALGIGAAGALTLRRERPAQPRLSFPPSASEGRISFV